MLTVVPEKGASVKRTGAIRFVSVVVTPLVALVPSVRAARSGALSFLENSDAKYAALGEAGTAASDDVAVMNYNPAGLGTMKSGQATFLYKQGLTQDAFGRLMIGAPTRAGALALSVGYYDAGNVDIDTGGGVSSVNAQKDYMVGLGFARPVGPVQFGVNAKFLRSTLVEQYSANTAALDFGIHTLIGSRLHFGAAVQNLGQGLKYADTADPLPTNYRVGAAWAFRSGAASPILLVDFPYFSHERELRPAVGLDVPVGPLSLRAGYQDIGGSHQLSVGAGFSIGRGSLDYSLGMANQLNATHRVSLSLRFGDAPAAPAFVNRPATPSLVSKPAAPTVEPSRQPVTPRYTLSNLHPAARRRVYEVRPGDTLAVIAKREYGDAREWTAIYSANKYLLGDPKKLEPGQKIVLP